MTTMTLERRVSTPKGGRPKRDESGQGTRQVRVFDDVADMLSWICEVQRLSSAVVLDPLIRNVIQRRYTELYPTIRKVKALADEAAVVAGHEPGPPLPQLTATDPITGESATLEEIANRQEELADHPADQKKKPKK